MPDVPFHSTVHIDMDVHTYGLYIYLYLCVQALDESRRPRLKVRGVKSNSVCINCTMPVCYKYMYNYLYTFMFCFS